ncbi:MAG: SurA N-terminal domain-containing protein [Pseudomonadota bacterium]
MATGTASKAFVWVILGLLIVALAGFGATSFGGQVRSIGKVGETEIPTDTYARALQAELSALSAQMGQSVSFAQARAFGIDQQVLGRVVSDAALDEATRAIGISVGDDTVRERIFEIPGFQGADGAFDPEAYRFTLGRQGVTVAEFEEQIRSNTARSVLQAAVIGGVTTPPVYADTLYDWARQTRDITWARLTEDNLEITTPVPDDATLRAFHNDNENLFTVPETRAITYVWLTTDMVLDTVEVDEARLREFYDEQIEMFVRPERRLVERLVYSSDEAAAEAKARLDSGEVTFDALVEERGLTLDDVDLGEVRSVDLDEAGEIVFALEGPGIAGPARSVFGPALFRVNAVLAAQETPFEDVVDELRAELATDTARRTILDMEEDMADLLAGGATLEDLAAETEIRLGTIEWRPDVDIDIAAYDAFRAEARRVAEGDFPEILRLDEDGLFALRLDEVIAPRVEPFDDVAEAVTEAWRNDWTASTLEAEANAVAEELRGGREMAGLGLALNTDRGVLRDAFLEGTPPDFVDRVFGMEDGEIVVLTDELGAMVIRLDAVNGPDPNDAEGNALRDQFAGQVSQDFANDILTYFTIATQTEAGIELNQQALNAVHAAFN